MDRFQNIPLPTLESQLLWEARVDVGPLEPLGQGPYGERRIVRILGGEFRGGPAFPDFHGTVPAGGADRQTVRADGTKELDALYEMRVADGTELTIRNRVIIDETVTPRYALSRIEVTAPEGPWAWLSRRIIIGTLHPLQPVASAVVIRAWLVTS